MDEIHAILMELVGYTIGQILRPLSREHSVEAIRKIPKLQAAIKTAEEQIEVQHNRVVDALIEAGKSLGIENAELTAQLQQQHEDATDG